MCDYSMKYNLIRMSFSGLYITFNECDKALKAFKVIFEPKSEAKL